jgi:hypothetical protein
MPANFHLGTPTPGWRHPEEHAIALPDLTVLRDQTYKPLQIHLRLGASPAALLAPAAKSIFRGRVDHQDPLLPSASVSVRGPFWGLDLELKGCGL